MIISLQGFFGGFPTAVHGIIYWFHIQEICAAVPKIIIMFMLRNYDTSLQGFLGDFATEFHGTIYSFHIQEIPVAVPKITNKN